MSGLFTFSSESTADVQLLSQTKLMQEMGLGTFSGTAPAIRASQISQWLMLGGSSVEVYGKDGFPQAVALPVSRNEPVIRGSWLSENGRL